MKNDICYVYNNQYQLCTEMIEVRMSHWVNSFYLRNSLSGAIFLDFRIKTCDLVWYKEEEDKLSLYFRVYPNGRLEQIIIVDLKEEALVHKGVSHPYSELEELLNSM